MKERYSTELSKKAAKDLDNIIDYCLDNSYANELIKSLKKAIKNLKSFPFMGKIYSNTNIDNQYHVISANNYLIFYLIEKKTVRIVRILHEKQNYIDIIEKIRNLN